MMNIFWMICRCNLGRGLARGPRRQGNASCNSFKKLSNWSNKRPSKPISFFLSCFMFVHCFSCVALNACEFALLCKIFADPCQHAKRSCLPNFSSSNWWIFFLWKRRLWARPNWIQEIKKHTKWAKNLLPSYFRHFNKITLMTKRLNLTTNICDECFEVFQIELLARCDPCDVDKK